MQQVCFQFLQRGACKFGSSCRFLHAQAGGGMGWLAQAGAPTPPAVPQHYAPVQQLHAVPSAGGGFRGGQRQTPATASPSDIPRAWTSNPAVQMDAGGAKFDFRLMSFNVLADTLAYEHAHELYPDCDSWCLAWPRRLGWVVEHVQQHMPDVLCLQEVDHWDQLRATLQPFGYDGAYVQRTGGRSDGCATLWLRHRLAAKSVQPILMCDHGLKDNVALIVSLMPISTAAAGAAAGAAAPAAATGGLQHQQGGEEPAAPGLDPDPGCSGSGGRPPTPGKGPGRSDRSRGLATAASADDDGDGGGDAAAVPGPSAMDVDAAPAGGATAQRRRSSGPGGGGGGGGGGSSAGAARAGSAPRHPRIVWGEGSDPDGPGVPLPPAAPAAALRPGGGAEASNVAAGRRAVAVSGPGPARGKRSSDDDSSSGSEGAAASMQDAAAAAAAAASATSPNKRQRQPAAPGGGGGEGASGAAGARSAAAEASGRRQPAQQQLPACGGLLVANTHVLFNPKRGDIKLGQLRVVLEAMRQHGAQLGAPPQQAGEEAEEAPPGVDPAAGPPGATPPPPACIFVGDFNMGPGSALYRYMAEGCLDLMYEDRRHMTGQMEGYGYPQLARDRRRGQGLPPPYRQPQPQQPEPLLPADPHRPRPAGAGSGAGPAPVQGRGQGQHAFAALPPPPPPSSVSGGGRRLVWPMEELVAALGQQAAGQLPMPMVRFRTDGSPFYPRTGHNSRIPLVTEVAHVTSHGLALGSAYHAVDGHEPRYTTLHNRYVGTVDYVWFASPPPPSGSSSSGACRLTPLRALQPPDVYRFPRGMPCPGWPSDHVSLVVDFRLQQL